MKIDDWANKHHIERKICDTDICDYCQKEKANITDGTYVYCSERCKQLFIENVFLAIEEADKKLIDNKGDINV